MIAYMTFDVQLGKDDDREAVAEKCREVGAILAASKRRLTVGLEAKAKDELNAGFTLAMMYATLTNEVYAMGGEPRVSEPKSLLVV